MMNLFFTTNLFTFSILQNTQKTTERENYKLIDSQSSIYHFYSAFNILLEQMLHASKDPCSLLNIDFEEKRRRLYIEVLELFFQI